ncbi:MAG: adenylate/guanylate cyclase domain-containing protein [Deltaproteobacteria bacterium]|nr:adenylate/guanylate cyclase domain-containing protein [Deltaproteobacteria bacterium]
MAIKTLQQRITLLLLLPIAAVIIITGVLGFLYAKENLLNEWRDGAIVKLQRAAHYIDMRLNRPIEWMEMFHKTAGGMGAYAIQQWILEQLRELDGVTGVDLQWTGDSQSTEPAPMPMMRRGGMGQAISQGGTGTHRGMGFHRAGISEVTAPRYDARTGEETVTLISNLKDESGEVVGRLKVDVAFDYLMQDIIRLGWWQGDKACLVDDAGYYLAHTDAMMKQRERLGRDGDPLEKAILKAMDERPYGTILGSGHPSSEVSGFYRIKEAPWTIILFAPGKKVLAPIIRYRLYYSIGGIACLILILFLIRFVAGNMANAIKEIAKAAGEVAKGNYGEELSVKRADEIGQLGRSFNEMVTGLKERDFIRNTFGRYVDPEIASALMSRPEAGKLGGQKRQVAILMVDIRGFTPLSESLSLDRIIDLLNRYFTRMIDVIHRYEGIIVDFFGDSVLVFFDPMEGPVSPMVQKSVGCALDMQAEMADFNRENSQHGLPELEMGIGINAGDVVVGNIGSEKRAKYGIVGSPVNMTQRIQSHARGGEILIAEIAYQHVSEMVSVERTLKTVIKGVEGEVTLYGVKAQPS